MTWWVNRRCSSPESIPDASYPGRAVLYPADGGLDFLPVDTPSVGLAINDAGQVLAIGVTPPAPNGPRNSAAFILTLSPAALIEELIEQIKDFGLPKGTENSLVTKLEHAQAALAAGDVGTARNLLGAFINETNAQSGRKLSRDQAAEMIDGTEERRAALGCD